MPFFLDKVGAGAMGAIEAAAFASVGRASGFAGLAILGVMLALSFEPALATRLGGVMAVGLASILALQAIRARTRPYQHTETWMILAENHRPPVAVAQKLIGEALGEAYLWFAERVAAAAILFLTLSLLFTLSGVFSSELK